jgi:hypothetical protein
LEARRTARDEPAAGLLRAEASMKIAGILLIIAGLSATFCGGFSYPNSDQTQHVGLIQVNDTENQTERIPPVFGIAGIAAGGAMVYLGKKQHI